MQLKNYPPSPLLAGASSSLSPYGIHEKNGDVLKNTCYTSYILVYMY